MSRIRTIKPAFFKHEELFDAEQESGLPLRLAFAGLWLVCDREGRFEWKARALKTDILPYDPVDFAEVLDALERYGFVVGYRVDGRRYGYVPSFLTHQRPNQREAQSVIPAPFSPSPAPDGSGAGSAELEPSSPPIELEDDASACEADARTCTHMHTPGEREGEGEREREGERRRPPPAQACEREADPPGGHAPPARLEVDVSALLADVMDAAGLRDRVPAYWTPTIACQTVARWITDLGLTPEEILTVVKDARRSFDEAPRGPRAFDHFMQAYAGERVRAKLTPLTSRRPGGRTPDPDWAEEAMAEGFARARGTVQ